MKKSNHNYRNLRSITSRICMAVVAFLGFGCSEDNNSEEPGEGIPCMYGTPTAVFEVKGKVADADGKEVGNAEIRVTYVNVPSGIYPLGIDASDTAGSYNVGGEMTGYPEDKVKVVCLPADKNLEPDSTIVTLKKVNDGDGAWNTGKGTATVDFTLKKKTAE